MPQNKWSIADCITNNVRISKFTTFGCGISQTELKSKIVLTLQRRQVRNLGNKPLTIISIWFVNKSRDKHLLTLNYFFRSRFSPVFHPLNGNLMVYWQIFSRQMTWSIFCGNLPQKSDFFLTKIYWYCQHNESIMGYTACHIDIYIKRK